ncbi:MAG: DNA-protecting protein DprA, partial [Proteobacteria bacterium]|nr:DNA-protecting protein DprA [Pseudomonadota bacterium]MBU1742933.1 DNA-protecting protein DprA [Pseudomonadota bacterium]
PPQGPAGLDQRAERIFELLGEKPVHIDLLVRRSGLGAAEVAVTLLNLELAGHVVQVPGKLFVKKDHV